MATRVTHLLCFWLAAARTLDSAEQSLVQLDRLVGPSREFWNCYYTVRQDRRDIDGYRRMVAQLGASS